MQSITFQPSLRPALPEVNGCKEYREERQLFIRIDELLQTSGLENDFIDLCLQHRGDDPKKITAKRLDSIARHCVLALRSNIARHYKNLDHRDFCIRLADSPLLQWFLQIGRVEGVKAFAKSSSDRFAHIIDEAGLRAINTRLIALLAGTHRPAGPIEFGLKTDINFDDIYFDSTCLKAPIHFPVDWVLLRDATRTLMKATALIRQAGHRHRMPQEPLSFLSDINTHCMKMTAKFRTKDGRKHRKAVLRDMKKLSKRIGKHAKNHLKILTTRASETELSKGQVRQISYRIQSVLDQLPAALKQAHERMIGGRKLPNSKKILSLYDPHVQVLKRGKSGAEVEFGNNLWLGETREGLIIDYLLEKEKTSDPKQIKPARFVAQQKPGGSAYVIGEGGLLNALHQNGYSIVEENPDFVIVGEGRTMTFEMIEKAVRLVAKGARLIATNLDPNCPTEAGIRPGCGAIAAMIESATGKKAFSVGKPSPIMMRAARKQLGLTSEETIMVGDTMETDILGGVGLRYRTILVMSGGTAKEDLADFAYSPDLVLDSVAHIPEAPDFAALPTNPAPKATYDRPAESHAASGTSVALH